MDIEMETMNGIAVGHQFRKCVNHDEVTLIYISSHESYSNTATNALITKSDEINECQREEYYGTCAFRWGTYVKKNNHIAVCVG